MHMMAAVFLLFTVHTKERFLQITIMAVFAEMRMPRLLPSAIASLIRLKTDSIGLKTLFIIWREHHQQIILTQVIIKGQFAGKGGTLKLNDSGDQGISAITGATVTSTAVVNAVNYGLKFFETVTKGGN